MSKKQLKTEDIVNELKGSSVFFSREDNGVRPVREERDESNARSVPPGHSVRRPVKRERKRHPFDIYRDQYETLLRLKSVHMMETGEMRSMSEMVREALDIYFEAEQNRTPRT